MYLTPHFWDFVDKTDTCWLWTGKLAGRGYGQASAKIDGRWTMVYAHRASYEMAHGSIPDGMLVLHSCDVPGCVRPEHLSVGTQAENLKQARERGRTHRKIPAYWVPAIRHGVDSGPALARFFGCSSTGSIYAIRSGRNFSWIQ